jgi:hypothetical protein
MGYCRILWGIVGLSRTGDGAVIHGGDGNAQESILALIVFECLASVKESNIFQ